MTRKVVFILGLIAILIISISISVVYAFDNQEYRKTTVAVSAPVEEPVEDKLTQSDFTPKAYQSLRENFDRPAVSYTEVENPGFIDIQNTHFPWYLHLDDRGPIHDPPYMQTLEGSEYVQIGQTTYKISQESTIHNPTIGGLVIEFLINFIGLLALFSVVIGSGLLVVLHEHDWDFREVLADK